MTHAVVCPANIYCATTMSQAAHQGHSSNKETPGPGLQSLLSKGYGQEELQERRSHRSQGCGRWSLREQRRLRVENKVRLQPGSVPGRDRQGAHVRQGQREQRVQNYLSKGFPRTRLFASINLLLGEHIWLSWEPTFYVLNKLFCKQLLKGHLT